MNEKKSMAFRFLCWKGAVFSFFRMLKRLPGFWKLNRFWDVEPSFYGWVIRQYSTVMNELTGGKLSKPSHSAETVIEEVWTYMTGHFAGWDNAGNK